MAFKFQPISMQKDSPFTILQPCLSGTRAMVCTRLEPSLGCLMLWSLAYIFWPVHSVTTFLSLQQHCIKPHKAVGLWHIQLPWERDVSGKVQTRTL